MTEPKPVTEIWKPELTRLAKLTRPRLAFRSFARGLAKFVVKVCLQVTAEGMENFPKQGPLLVVINHLGDADLPTLMSRMPSPPDALAEVELYDVPILGRLMDRYGVIWLHRGKPDKRALRAALDGLAEGRILVIAPEGRYSLTGALEEGTGGAAFLAYKSGAPILPVALSGTENEHVYGCLKKMKRARVHVTAGEMFRLTGQAEGRKEAISEGTQTIMRALASLLPEKYRGEYSDSHTIL